MRLNAAQLEFLGRLGKSPEGRQLQELISAEIADCNANLRKLSDESLYREQGKALYLDELAQRLIGPQAALVIPRRPTFQNPS